MVEVLIALSMAFSSGFLFAKSYAYAHTNRVRPIKVAPQNRVIGLYERRAVARPVCELEETMVCKTEIV